MSVIYQHHDGTWEEIGFIADGGIKFEASRESCEKPYYDIERAMDEINRQASLTFKVNKEAADAIRAFFAAWTLRYKRAHVRCSKKGRRVHVKRWYL